MRNPLPGWLCLVLLAGCHKPLLIQTQNKITVEGPVDTTTRLTTDPSPVPDSGPVQPMLVEGSSCQAGHGRIALIDVDGMLLNSDMTGPYSMGENPVNLFRERLAAAASDKEVSAVVLRINSPGGAVNASDLMHHELLDFKARTHKPVVAYLMGMGAGGAYLLASAADAIVADPTTITGGVGIIINLYNLKELMGQFNILPQPIKAGPHIDMGSSARNLTEEDRKLLQAMADEFHQYLQQQVLKGRPSIDLDNGTTFDGRVFTGVQALGRGLIDRIGFAEAALAVARQLGQCPEAGVVMYHRRNDPARTVYAQTPNLPLQGAGTLPNVPGLERSRLPLFLAMWQPDLTSERLGGR